MPVFLAESKWNRHYHNQDWSYDNQKPRPLGVEDWADLSTAKESEKSIHAKNPASTATAVIVQLMVFDIGLKRTHTVNNPKGREKSEPTSSDHNPCLKATFWIIILVNITRRAGYWCSECGWIMVGFKRHGVYLAVLQMVVGTLCW